MPAQIKIPFAIDANGEISTITDQRAIDRQNVITLLGTQPGERCMRPDYGVATRDVLFDPDDPMLAGVLTQSISNAMRTYEPELDLKRVDADPSQDDGVVEIEVQYQPSVTRLNTGIDSISTSVG
jgi:phage baseplate assembly protein W